MSAVTAACDTPSFNKDILDDSFVADASLGQSSRPLESEYRQRNSDGKGDVRTKVKNRQRIHLNEAKAVHPHAEEAQNILIFGKVPSPAAEEVIDEDDSNDVSDEDSFDDDSNTDDDSDLHNLDVDYDA